MCLPLVIPDKTQIAFPCSGFGQSVRQAAAEACLFFASAKVLCFFELCKSLQGCGLELAANDMSLNYFTVGKNFETICAVIEDMPMKTVRGVTPDCLFRS